MNKKKINLVFNSLIISLITLNTNELDSQQNINFAQNIIVEVESLSNYTSLSKLKLLFNETKRELITELLITLRETDIKTGNNISRKHEFKQYLRKFSFLYRRIILRGYPNDLSYIKCQKINMFAVNNLYILYSLYS